MQRPLIIIICLALFWLILTHNNYFHMDDWEFISRLNSGFVTMLTKPLAETFVPLNAFAYFLLLKTFGLNYLPFQTTVIVFHALNSLILYFLVALNTKSKRLALAAMLLFNLSSVSVDNLVWDMGMNFVLAGSCAFASYYFLTLFCQIKKNRFLLFSISLCLLAPLFHNIAILWPLGLAAVATLRGQNRLVAGYFFTVQAVEIAIALLARHSGLFVNATAPLSTLILQIPLYVASGLFKGVIYRFFIPDLYFLANLSYYTHPLRLLVSALGVLVSLYFAYRFLPHLKITKKQWLFFLELLVLLVLPYVAIAPFRARYGLEQATILRYTYLSFFIFLLLLANLLVGLPRKWLHFGLPVAAAGLCALHLIAIINFNLHWQQNTLKDRQFVTDASYFLERNSAVPDLPLHGLWGSLHLSQLQFLSPRPVRFLDPTAPFVSTDPKSSTIYFKLKTTYNTYDPTFSVPYSM